MGSLSFSTKVFLKIEQLFPVHFFSRRVLLISENDPGGVCTVVELTVVEST